jgi:hypothetical protein
MSIELTLLTEMSLSEWEAGLSDADARIDALRNQYEADRAKMADLDAHFIDINRRLRTPWQRYEEYCDAIEAAVHQQASLDSGDIYCAVSAESSQKSRLLGSTTAAVKYGSAMERKPPDGPQTRRSNWLKNEISNA